MLYSPYYGLDRNSWDLKTLELLEKLSLDRDIVIKTVKSSWDLVINTRIGEYQFGQDIFPSPQALGSYLHDIIPLELKKIFISSGRGDVWRVGRNNEKDIVNLIDESLSIEIKTSSSDGKIYGNRSYGKPQAEIAKEKRGYFIAVNFQKYEFEDIIPQITKISMGWLDHSDWRSQVSEKGQQASLPTHLYGTKLLEIYNPIHLIDRDNVEKFIISLNNAINLNEKDRFFYSRGISSKKGLNQKLKSLGYKKCMNKVNGKKNWSKNVER